MKLFSATTGIRGPADTFFTDDFCVKIGYTYGVWLKLKHKQGVVAVAIDPRESSPRIRNSVCLGLAAAGWDVLDEGVVPTPALTYFIKKSPHVAGGIMITGSHIEVHLNGLKFLVDGEEVTKIAEKEIEDLFDKYAHEKIAKVPANVKTESEAQEMYIQMLMDLAQPPYPDWRFIVDCANGAQSEIARQVFKRLNVKVDYLGENDFQASKFISKDTDNPSDFDELVRQVLLKRVDLGIAFDMDGDRAVFIDHTGRFVPGDFSCSLIASDSDTSSIVTPVSSSSVVDYTGKKVYRTKIGATNVIAKMKEVGSTFGFESNGGGISGEILYGRDGFTTVIKMLNLLKKADRNLHYLINKLPQLQIFKDKIDFPINKYDSVYSAVREKYHAKEIDDTDGLKVILGHEEWILFRGSSNAPEFRVFAQSHDARKVNELGLSALTFVKSVISGPGKTTPRLTSADSTGVQDSMLQFSKQCRQVLDDAPLLKDTSDWEGIENIVVSGMGGSALGGRILANLERLILKIPLTVSADFHLPNFVNKKTLVVVSSYSGNTEETLASLKEAQSRGAKVFVITSGGILGTIATNQKIPHYIFNPIHNPSRQPRIGLGYGIMSLLLILKELNFVDLPVELNEIPGFLEANLDKSKHSAREIAKSLKDKLPVIISSEHLKGVAHDFKNQLNENAKTFAVAFDLPEANHHLMEGLTNPASNKENLIAVFFQSDKYHREIAKRYPVTSTVFKKQGIATLDILAAGPTLLHQVMYMVQLTALISFALSQEYGIDPGPIPWVDYFKDEIKN